MAAPEHVGLGLGTQLSLATGRAVGLLLAGYDPPVKRLATWTGRGQRSGVGLHGFKLGGLIVDGGRREEGRVPSLITRLDFPEDWWVLVVIPRHEVGLHGDDEKVAFADLPRYPENLTERLCRLVLLDLLPAVVDRDLSSFGLALEEIQQRVGNCFAPAQGGAIYAHAGAEKMVSWLRSRRVYGVGQSSWGPTLYGFCGEKMTHREELLTDFREWFKLDEHEAFWTRSSQAGATVEVLK